MKNEQELEQRIAEYQTTAILLFDDGHRLLYLNASAETLFGLTRKRLIGVTAEQLLRLKSGGEKSCFERLEEAVTPFAEHAVSLRLPDGNEVMVDCVISPLENPGSKAREYIVELRLLDHQLRITRDNQLLVQHQAVSKMLRGLAHEVKNPLGGVRGAAQLLQSELDDEELKEYTHVIISEADRLKNLVDRMLGSNQLPHIVPMNIHAVLERVFQVVSVGVSPGVTLTRDYDPSIPEILADEDQLIQALLNITNNAIRALEGKGKVILRTRVLRQFLIGNVRHPLTMQIDIEDNGSGVPEELKETLFYPMVTASAGGTGLGLSIAQDIISHHGGLIEYESQPGKTVFSVLLPLEIKDDNP